MTAKRKALIETQREMWPFQYASHVFHFQFKEYHRRYDFGDSDSLEFDPRASEGWEKFKCAGLIFMAFWAESYINYALSQICADEYSYLERNPTLSKLELVCQKTDVLYDKAIFKKLFKFRNKLAHGKKFDAKSQNEMSLDDYNQNHSASIALPFVPRSDWEEYLTKIDEENLENQMMQVFDDIQAAAELKFYANGLGDMTSQSVTIEG